jgi:negative regulator of sigma E activity
MYDKNKLDELLNAYMDGQLTERRRTEVKRLLQHDREIAARLMEIKKIRSLLAAVPSAEAPPDLVQNVKTKIEQRSFTRPGTDYLDKTEGARQLLWRRAISIAAIVTLAVALAAVVYIIVGPQPSKEEHLVSENWIKEEIPLPESITNRTAPAAPPADTTSPVQETATASAQQTPLPEQFTGRLELNTAFFTGVDAFIKRSLVDNGIMLIELPVAQSEKGVYSISCSRNAAEMFIADLTTIWDRFDSVMLSVDTGQPGKDIVVTNVTAKQINEIIAQPDVAKSIQLAKDTAAFNSVTRNLPGTILAVGTDINSLTIPKPVLTSPDKTPKKPDRGNETEIIELVIQIKSTS